MSYAEAAALRKVLLRVIKHVKRGDVSAHMGIRVNSWSVTFPEVPFDLGFISQFNDTMGAEAALLRGRDREVPSANNVPAVPTAVNSTVAWARR